jgi:hypothetical protein
LGIILLLQVGEVAGEFSIGEEHFAQADECLHDRNVYLHSAPAAKDAGEHGDPLLGKGHWSGPAKFAHPRYHIL